MALTPDEEVQFKDLSAHFMTENTVDVKALKEMDKRDASSEMVFLPLPSMNSIRTFLERAFMVLFFVFGALSPIALFMGNRDAVPFFAALALASMGAQFVVAPKTPCNSSNDVLN